MSPYQPEPQVAPVAPMDPVVATATGSGATRTGSGTTRAGSGATRAGSGTTTTKSCGSSVCFGFSVDCIGAPVISPMSGHKARPANLRQINQVPAPDFTAV